MQRGTQPCGMIWVLVIPLVCASALVEELPPVLSPIPSSNVSIVIGPASPFWLNREEQHEVSVSSPESSVEVRISKGEIKKGEFIQLSFSSPTPLGLIVTALPSNERRSNFGAWISQLSKQNNVEHVLHSYTFHVPICHFFLWLRAPSTSRGILSLKHEVEVTDEDFSLADSFGEVGSLIMRNGSTDLLDKEDPDSQLASLFSLPSEVTQAMLTPSGITRDLNQTKLRQPVLRYYRLSNAVKEPQRKLRTSEKELIGLASQSLEGNFNIGNIIEVEIPSPNSIIKMLKGDALFLSFIFQNEQLPSNVRVLLNLRNSAEGKDSSIFNFINGPQQVVANKTVTHIPLIAANTSYANNATFYADFEAPLLVRIMLIDLMPSREEPWSTTFNLHGEAVQSSFLISTEAPTETPISTPTQEDKPNVFTLPSTSPPLTSHPLPAPSFTTRARHFAIWLYRMLLAAIAMILAVLCILTTLSVGLFVVDPVSLAFIVRSIPGFDTNPTCVKFADWLEASAVPSGNREEQPTLLNQQDEEITPLDRAAAESFPSPINPEQLSALQLVFLPSSAEKKGGSGADPFAAAAAAEIPAQVKKSKAPVFRPPTEDDYIAVGEEEVEEKKDRRRERPLRIEESESLLDHSD